MKYRLRLRVFQLIGKGFILSLIHGVLLWAGDLPTKPLDFNRDIRPILSDTCFVCHGPDDGQRMANLRLDTKAGAFADRGGYQVIVPGNPAASRVYQRISSKDPGMHMPPVTFERNLTEAQVELIRQWIEQGAKWQTHWAYETPVRPELPAVKNPQWPRNSIDNFILSRLEKEGLTPSPETDRATLLRRLSLDLTGLPPTPEEVQAFVSDPSPDAYEKRVDQLLASPHYGERMAMQWLDLARYADSHGYHIDSLREMWHWRDWVINAYNKDMPFDQFTIEQLAGDLLPNATIQQKIASGFNRNHMINFEGGAIPEEYQNEYVIDRVDTTGTVWMGMAIGCARCHDHKYDPIKQKEYYRVYAFFNDIPEKGLDGFRGNAKPFLLLPNSSDEARLNDLKTRISADEKVLTEKQIAELAETWQKTRMTTIPQPPKDGLLANYEFDGFLADTSGNYQHAKVLKGQIAYNKGYIRQSGELDGESQVEFLKTDAIEWNHPFSVGIWLNPVNIPIGRKDIGILHQSSEGEERRGFEVFYEEIQKIPGFRRGSRVVVRLVHHWPENAIQVRTKEPVVLGTKDPVVLEAWRNYVVTYDGSGKGAGIKLYVDGKQVETETLQDTLKGTVQVEGGLQIGNKKIASVYKGFIDDLRVYDRAITPAQIDVLVKHFPMRIVLADLADKPFVWIDPVKQQAASLEEPGGDKPKESKQDLELKTLRTRVADYFLTYDAPQEIRDAYSDWKLLNTQKSDLEEAIPSAMVMREAKQPRESFVLMRGDYRNHGEKVQPAVLTWLAPMPKEAPLNRLGFAKWLVDPRHPLTSRVAVNRYWQNYFGIGLVKTSENFGSQGEIPSHPELLDWLATEFIRTGWDVKAMQRLIVTSATYRQSSRVSPELQERDPENRLLARGPRFRLQAEMVRDNVLAVSGLLNPEIGGPSVYPYQPKGLWEEMSFGEIFTGQTYQASTGKDLYRRSMYSIWKRTVPPASLATFDAPDREKCTSRRARTNTPLQALVLLNDPTYVEASRALAQRMITQGGNDPAKRIQYAYRWALSRNPVPRETQVLRDLADKELAHYRQDSPAALELLNIGDSSYDKNLNASELAAWTTVASTILNLDETVTKE